MLKELEGGVAIFLRTLVKVVIAAKITQPPMPAAAQIRTTSLA